MDSKMFNAGVYVLSQSRNEIIISTEDEAQTILFATCIANKITLKKQQVTVLIPKDVKSLASPLIDGIEMNEFHHIEADEFQKLFEQSEYDCEESGPCGDGYRVFVVRV